MKDVIILAVETATTMCSVSLAINGIEVGKRESAEPNIHNAALTVFVGELLSEHKLTMSDISAVAVSKGPGSYTGLRIGVSVAKGLCYALDIPLIAIDTLQAMASGFKSVQSDSAVLYCPMIDARRMEVYMAIYDASLYSVQDTSATIIDTSSFFDHLIEEHKKLVLFGTGADKFSELFAINSNVQVVSSFPNSASYLQSLAYAKFQQGDFEDVAYFEPFYLKDFVATTPKKLI